MYILELLILGILVIGLILCFVPHYIRGSSRSGTNCSISLSTLEKKNTLLERKWSFMLTFNEKLESFGRDFPTSKLGEEGINEYLQKYKDTYIKSKSDYFAKYNNEAITLNATAKPPSDHPEDQGVYKNGHEAKMLEVQNKLLLDAIEGSKGFLKNGFYSAEYCDWDSFISGSKFSDSLRPEDSDRLLLALTDLRKDMDYFEREGFCRGF